MPDLLIHNEGTVVGFQPATAEGEDWLAENVQAELWQYLGPTLWVDHRMAGPVIEGAINDGLSVS